MIRIREVRIIDDQGQQLSACRSEALAQAQEKGLDLVEVAPARSTRAPILDYGQYSTSSRSAARAEEEEKSKTFKMRLRVKVDVHDLKVKARRAGEFLDQGNRVQATPSSSGGSEWSHANRGRDLLDRARRRCSRRKGVVDAHPLLEGRNRFIVMAPPEKRVEKKRRCGPRWG